MSQLIQWQRYIGLCIIEGIIVMESDSEWQVEQILERGRFNNITYYLVKWQGYSREEATWEPITNLEHCQHAICQFQAALKNIKRKGKGKRGAKKTKMNLEKVFGSQQISELKNKLLDGQSREGGQPSQKIAKQEASTDKSPMIEIVTTRKSKMTLDDQAELPKANSSNTAKGSASVSEVSEEVKKNPKKGIHKKEIPVVDVSQLELYVPQLPEEHGRQEQTKNVEPTSRPPSPMTRTTSQFNKSIQDTRMNPQRQQAIISENGEGKIHDEDTNESQGEVRMEHSQPSEIQVRLPSQLISLLNHPRRIQCDQLLVKSQRQLIRGLQQSTPSNVHREKPVFLDLRDNPAALEQLGPIDIFRGESVAMEIKMMGRLSFGWIGIGIAEERWALAAVESLDEPSWSKFKDAFEM